MEEEFKEYLEKFLCFLFPNGTVEAKTVAGNQILASDLTDYVESYVDLLNSDESLSSQSIFQVDNVLNNGFLSTLKTLIYHII